MELDPKMVEIFKKVEVTIPLFDAIHQVLKYAKFLKDLCINKDKIHNLETIRLGSSISALMGAIPKKYGDPGLCMVTCTIDDKSIISVVRIAKDMLMSIKGLTFPIDFYILEMPLNDSGRASSVLLGRPFLKTSNFKLDAFSGTYSFEIDGRTVSFNLDEAVKHPPEDHSIFQCDIIDETVAKVHQEEVEEMHMEQGTSVGRTSEPTEDTLPPHIAPEDHKDVEFELSTDCMEAFDKLKIALTQAPIVRGPEWSQPFEIMCDASNYAVGAALAQCDGKDPFIIAYASKTLDAAQRLTGLLKRHGIVHKVEMAYHPQNNGQAEVSNREIKHIMEKVVKPHRKDWSSKLADALWAYRTAYKTPIGMRDGVEWKLQLQELECLRLEAYENSRLYKEKVRAVHDKNIMRREFRLADLVLLYNSRLRLMPRKLQSRWEGPYRVEKAEPYGIFHLSHPSSPNILKVNVHPLKLYHGEKSIYVRQKQVPVSKGAIQRALDLPLKLEGLDAYQKASFKRQTYQFDWNSVLGVIAQPGSK
ncbi:uncharacterized protein [Arachis hypogaea]|uniref:uncharacterized protein n=1 Tax=Arachis hypogaea TaxID=3818 RepID=UPI003B217D24